MILGIEGNNGRDENWNILFDLNYRIFRQKHLGEEKMFLKEGIEFG